MNSLSFNPYFSTAPSPYAATSAPVTNAPNFWGGQQSGYGLASTPVATNSVPNFSFNPAAFWGNKSYAPAPATVPAATAAPAPVVAPTPNPNTTIVVDQNGDNNKAQGDGAKTDVVINQNDTSGGNTGTNTVNVKNMQGDLTVDSNGANNTINVDGVKGITNINADSQATDAEGNVVHTDDTQGGLYFLARGNTYLHSTDSPFVDAEINGNDGKSDNYRIRIEGTEGDKDNSIFVEADKYDNVTVDITNANNASDIRIRGDVNKLNIRALNGQSDTIRINEGLTLDLTNFDEFDTVVITNQQGHRNVTTAGELRKQAGLPKEGVAKAEEKATTTTEPAPTYSTPRPRKDMWNTYVPPAPVASTTPASLTDWFNSFWQ